MRAALCLLGVCLADRGEQAVDDRRLGAQQSLQLGGVEQLLSLCLLDHEVLEQCVPGEVAAQDGVEVDARAGSEAGLGEKGLWDRRGARLAALDPLKAVLDASETAPRRPSAYSGPPPLGGSETA